MVTIYDMDTYGIREPDEDTPTLGFTAHTAANLATIPTPELQLIQVSPEPLRENMHPALQHISVDSFLASISD